MKLSRLPLLFASSACLCAQGPQIFFSDLVSGPNLGGENNAGVYVTIYGRNFGSMRGAGAFVSIGGGQAAAYPTWTDTRITFQLGQAAATGNIVVNEGSVQSNGIPFTVRDGNIYFVSVSGNDSNNGSFTAPWSTLLKARDTIAAGDTVYAMDGVSQTVDDGQGWNTCMLLRTGGTAAAPKALVAYPGAGVTIGNVSGPDSGIRTDTGADYWVFAGLTLRGQNEAMTPYGSTGWRIVGNDMSCPNGDGESGCFESGVFTNAAFYGNHVHDTGKTGASDQYQGVYFSTDSNHLDIGWNVIENVQGCRGIQIHSSPLDSNSGLNQYDISIHDNVIHDIQCDGIVLATVDPSKGAVEVYNNIIYRAGKGPATPEGGGNFSCVSAPGYTNNGAAGGGTIDVRNNTMYDCGAMKQAGSSGAVENGGNNPNLSLRIVNNIIDQPAGQDYITSWGADGYSTSAGGTGITGSNNLFFGNGPGPSGFDPSVNADPQFVSLTIPDFHLLARSAAHGSGVNGQDLGALPFETAAVKSVSCTPAAVVAPGSSACQVSLTTPAPSGGTKITLTTDSAAAVVPTSVTVPAGATEASVTVSAGPATTRTAATITATQPGAGSAAGTVWLLPQGDKAPLLLSVADSATFAPIPLTPGGMVSIFGLNLGPGQGLGAQVQGGLITTTLASTQALFDGVAAPLIYAQADQLNVVVPYAVAGQSTVQVQIAVAGALSNALVLPTAPTTPGLFTVNMSGGGQVVAVNQDGTVNSPSHPAPRTSVVYFYADGLGRTNAPGVDGLLAGSTPPQAVAPVSAQVGGVDAQVQYAGGAPNFIAGLFQVNVRIPDNAPVGPAVSLQLTAGGVSSAPGVTLAVQ